MNCLGDRTSVPYLFSKYSQIFKVIFRFCGYDKRYEKRFAWFHANGFGIEIYKMWMRKISGRINLWNI